MLHSGGWEYGITISQTRETIMALGKRTGEFERRPTSVAIDDVGKDLRQAPNTQSKLSRATRESTFAWVRVALATGLAVLLSVFVLACSSGKRSEQTQTPATPNNPTAQPEEPARPTELTDSGGMDLPPIVKTPWKGDLDEMAKRRAVRVLLPFRR